MKKIPLLLVFNISILAIAQESAFIISNKQVVWQRIYQSTKTPAEVKNILLTTGKIKFTGEDTNTLTGEFSDFMMDFKGAGYTKMGTPIYLANSTKFSGNFKIEFKEGKYRATATNINSKEIVQHYTMEEFQLEIMGRILLKNLPSQMIENILKEHLKAEHQE